MTQTARPETDALVGTWTDQDAGTTDLWSTIDEASANDADYVESEVAPAASPYVTFLSAVTDPASSADHSVHYRYAKDAAGGSQIDLDVELRQGYVDEGTPGTLIASNSHVNISDTWTDGSFTLSAGEADSITDYSDLALRFVATQV